VRELYRIDLGEPAILQFHGPDAVRFLNGQVTQDVRLLTSENKVLPSCVTDAKGRLQFRISLTGVDGYLWICGASEQAGELAARITRYLIADDVETADLTGMWRLVHFTGKPLNVPAGVIIRESKRFGVSGTDWFFRKDADIIFPEEFTFLEGDALEDYRITHGVPNWGRELIEGMMLSEARLDESDISYQKGCYVGQEVISRIKSVGKVNKLLTRFLLPAGVSTSGGDLVDALGAPAGTITSVSPLAKSGMYVALGFVKRGVTSSFMMGADGERFPVQRI
jgi:folate-binding protein YgfZ